MDIDVSIIYVNYKTSALIADSIRSVAKHVKDITYELIIVDNNSEKDLETKLLPQIPTEVETSFIHLPENIGFGRANNEGAKVAKGKYIFLLNPDTLLLNNAIKILFDFIESRPKVGVCGGNLFDKDNNPMFSFRKIFPGPLWDFMELTNHKFRYPKNKKKSFFNFSDKPTKVAYIAGADLMIKTRIYKECKGFPEDLFMYWDDVEICKRVKDLGYEVYNVPQAKICHLESRSFENVTSKNSFKIELQEKYRLIYLKRNVGKTKYFISNRIFHLFLISRTAFLPNGPKRDFYKTHKDYFLKYLKAQ